MSWQPFLSFPRRLVSGGPTQQNTLFSPNNMSSNTAPSPFVASADSNQASYPPWEAFDGVNTDTGGGNGWRPTNTSLPHWIKLDIGSGNTQYCYTYKITVRSDASSDKPTSWTLAGSNDDSSYTTVDTQTSVTWSGGAGEEKTFTCANPTVGAYRYWRLDVTAAQSNDFYIQEIKLYN
jgi:hypothetical protein